MPDLLSLGYAGLFLLSFALNVLPFMGPSNALLAGALAASLPWGNPLVIGLLVALAASLAKLIHFVTAFSLRRTLSPERKEKLERYRWRTGNVGALLLFIAAASSIPDEPVVIPLGLMRYSPTKFFLTYLSGKMVVTIPGAYIGSRIPIPNIIGSPLAALTSIVVTIAATYVLMRIDLEKVAEKLTKRMIHQK